MLSLGFQFGLGFILALSVVNLFITFVKKISLLLARVKIEKALKKSFKDYMKGEK